MPPRRDNPHYFSKKTKINLKEKTKSDKKNTQMAREKRLAFENREHFHPTHKECSRLRKHGARRLSRWWSVVYV